MSWKKKKQTSPQVVHGILTHLLSMRERIVRMACVVQVRQSHQSTLPSRSSPVVQLISNETCLSCSNSSYEWTIIKLHPNSHRKCSGLLHYPVTFISGPWCWSLGKKIPFFFASLSCRCFFKGQASPRVFQHFNRNINKHLRLWEVIDFLCRQMGQNCSQWLGIMAISAEGLQKWNSKYRYTDSMIPHTKSVILGKKENCINRQKMFSRYQRSNVFIRVPFLTLFNTRIKLARIPKER